MYLRTLIILISSFLLGCSGDEFKKHANSENRNTHPLNSDSFWELSKEPDLIIHSSNNDSGVQLYRASDGRILDNNKILIANSGLSQVLLFDSAGVFLKQTGQEGRGPNDFAEFSNIKIHELGAQLLLTDNSNHRAHFFDYDLNYQATLNYPKADDHGRLALIDTTINGNLIFLASQGGGYLRGQDGDLIEMYRSVFSFNPSTNQIQRITSLPSRRRMVLKIDENTSFPFIPFDKNPILLAYQANTFLVSSSVHPKISILNSLGEPVDSIYYNAPMVLTKDVWQSYKSEIEDWENEAHKKRYRVFYNKPLPLNKYVPSIDEIIVDANCYLWARRNRIDTSLPQKWDVLNTNGDWLGVIEVPSHFTITDIGNTYVFGYTTESGDEEFRKYALLKN